jgi:ribonuclease E
VLRRLTECLGRDRTKHQVTEITSLGLVQMTRKRIGAGLLEAFSETCECCKGRGVIIHTEPVPEKPRSGAGDRVKAVASAATNAPATSAPATNASATSAPAGNAPATSAPTASAEPAAAPVAPTRRRGRKAASERVVVEASDYQDTMGYDLSRYEAESPSTPDAAETPAAEPMRLAGPGDPDALPENGDLDADADVVEPGARRRIRRGSARRRTRP